MTAGAARPRVLLLTSHAVAPPWDGGDKNMARLLLEGAAGVDYAYAGGPGDGTPWQRPHLPADFTFRDDRPSPLDKLRLLGWLAAHPPPADLVHILVTFQSRRIQHALLALPLLRRHPFLVTCLTRTNLPERLLRRSGCVVAISEHTAGLLGQAGVRRIELIRPGVDLDRFSAQPPADGGPPRLLFAGHHDRGGGLAAALGFVAMLRPRLPGVRLVVAMRLRRGESRQSSGEGLRRLAEAAGVAGYVDDLGTQRDIRDAFRQCIAVLFQPDTLGMKMELPMTLLEALATGRPVITSPVPPLDELADGGRAVTVAAPGDEAALEHVRRLALDPEYRAEVGGEARSLAEREYSAARMVAAYRDLYPSLVAAPEPARLWA